MNSIQYDWNALFQKICAAIGNDYTASVNYIASDTKNPFHVLISTIISLRTRDEITLPASQRLLSAANDPYSIITLSQEKIASLIYPANFYRTKAKTIHEVCQIICTKYNGVTPSSIEKLTALHGVGRKTANLVRALGFGIKAICVDTHVHRIANRTGWVCTKTPLATEHALMAILPQKYWIPINQWLVGFGKKICTPQSPWCNTCPLCNQCKKAGVTRFR